MTKKVKTQTEEKDYLDLDTALNIALEMIKDNPIPRDKVYVWRQRYKEGKLSMKKMDEIMEMAGFKSVIEPKYANKKIPENLQEKFIKEKAA